MRWVAPFPTTLTFVYFSFLWEFSGTKLIETPLSKFCAFFSENWYLLGASMQLKYLFVCAHVASSLCSIEIVNHNHLNSFLTTIVSLFFNFYKNSFLIITYIEKKFTFVISYFAINLLIFSITPGTSIIYGGICGLR